MSTRNRNRRKQRAARARKQQHGISYQQALGQLQAGGYPPTSWPLIDRRLGPALGRVDAGTFAVLRGKSGVGKTSLAAHIAAAIAAAGGRPVIVCLEQSAETVARRIRAAGGDPDQVGFFEPFNGPFDPAGLPALLDAQPRPPSVLLIDHAGLLSGAGEQIAQLLEELCVERELATILVQQSPKAFPFGAPPATAATDPFSRRARMVIDIWQPGQLTHAGSFPDRRVDMRVCRPGAAPLSFQASFAELLPGLEELVAEEAALAGRGFAPTGVRELDRLLGGDGVHLGSVALLCFKEGVDGRAIRDWLSWTLGQPVKTTPAGLMSPVSDQRQVLLVELPAAGGDQTDLEVIRNLEALARSERKAVIALYPTAQAPAQTALGRGSIRIIEQVSYLLTCRASGRTGYYELDMLKNRYGPGGAFTFKL